MKFNKDDPRVYSFILTLTCTVILCILTLITTTIFCREDDMVRAFMIGMTYGVAIFPQFICRAVVSKMKKDDEDDSDDRPDKQHD